MPDEAPVHLDDTFIGQLAQYAREGFLGQIELGGDLSFGSGE